MIKIKYINKKVVKEKSFLYFKSYNEDSIKEIGIMPIIKEFKTKWDCLKDNKPISFSKKTLREVGKSLYHYKQLNEHPILIERDEYNQIWNETINKEISDSEISIKKLQAEIVRLKALIIKE